MSRIFAYAAALMAGATIFLHATAARAQFIDLTPPTGSVVELDSPYWASKGYQLTATQNLNISGLEWWLTLPANVTIAARIYDVNGALLATGTVASGNGTEQWYQSNVSFTFLVGQTYTVGFYHSSAMSGIFDRKDNFTMGFAVSPYFNNVNGRSNCGSIYQEDVFPSCANYWGPYIRMVTAQQFCGDGIVSAPETCDDGNAIDGDGCSPLCAVESGWTCTGQPSICMSTCGDGLIAGSEQCDDGGTTPMDGCDAMCGTEMGWMCNGSPSVCDTICGDGIIAGAEQCDDSNMLSGDGCDSSCVNESTVGAGGMTSSASTGPGTTSSASTGGASGDEDDDSQRVGGCGCRTVGNRKVPEALWIAALLGAALLRRRARACSARASR